MGESKKFSITGEIKGVSRATIIAAQKRLGFDYDPKVTADTCFLMVGDFAGSRLTRARQLGIQIVKLT